MRDSKNGKGAKENFTESRDHGEFLQWFMRFQHRTKKQKTLKPPACLIEFSEAGKANLNVFPTHTALRVFDSIESWTTDSGMLGLLLIGVSVASVPPPHGNP